MLLPLLARGRPAFMSAATITTRQHLTPMGSRIPRHRWFSNEPVRLRLPEDDATAGTQRGITKWFKEEGQQVRTGEAVCEVDSGDVVYDFVSPVNGFLVKITANAGAVDLKGGEVIAFIASTADAITSVKYEAAKEIAEGRVVVHGAQQQKLAEADELRLLDSPVHDWLKKLGGSDLAQQYSKTMIEDGFGSLESLVNLAEEDLTAMGITKTG
jgi:hypothetical protein